MSKNTGLDFSHARGNLMHKIVRQHGTNVLMKLGFGYRNAGQEAWYYEVVDQPLFIKEGSFSKLNVSDEVAEVMYKLQNANGNG